MDRYSCYGEKMTDQTYLNRYFSDVWDRNDALEPWEQAIAEAIDPTASVIDVGCGPNLFQEYFVDIVGIDPANQLADHQVTIEEFQTEKRFDVALCLGSINFGSRERIEHQIACVVKLLKPQAYIYWKCNPGLHDHENHECEQIDFYPWSESEHQRLSAQFGFRLERCEQIESGKQRRRLLAVWRRG